VVGTDKRVSRLLPLFTRLFWGCIDQMRVIPRQASGAAPQLYRVERMLTHNWGVGGGQTREYVLMYTRLFWEECVWGHPCHAVPQHYGSKHMLKNAKVGSPSKLLRGLLGSDLALDLVRRPTQGFQQSMRQMSGRVGGGHTWDWHCPNRGPTLVKQHLVQHSSTILSVC